MKKIILLLGMLLGSVPAMAGPLVAMPVGPNAVTASPLFRDQEIYFDLYGSYLKRYESDCSCDDKHEGYGGGLSVGYFFAYYVGARFDVNFSSVEAANTTIAGDVVFRYPIPETPIAPYGFVGGGLVPDHGNHAFLRVGGGVEWRITPHFGLFGEASYAWLHPEAEDKDLMIKAGVRVVF